MDRERENSERKWVKIRGKEWKRKEEKEKEKKEKKK